jgi:hypothetical protein
MNDGPIGSVEEYFENRFRESQLIGLVRSLKERSEASYLFGNTVRPLTDDEIECLRRQGCEASDWRSIHVVAGFDPGRVTETRFQGKCVLGRLAGTHEIAPGVRVPSGIRRSLLADCEVGNDALVLDCPLVANYLIGDGARLRAVGEIIAAPNAAFGNGVEMALALETGERSIRSFAEIDLELAVRLVREPRASDFRRAYDDFMRRYLEALKLPKGYIGPKAVIQVCGRVRDTIVGEGAVIHGASVVQNSTLLSSADEPVHVGDGAAVINSILQWGASAESGAHVESAVLLEHSEAERKVQVTESLIAPNTQVGRGEVACSLLGPFVGFHHESLLIAAFWPGGKGNVGYGANVGSNHTSKAPDQEVWPAEGMFFGLDSSIKLPSNFARSPYTIIATGVKTLPQKVEFPFSLINTPSESFPGVSPAFNEIIPAWVLSDNIYTIARNEAKYRERNRARRTPIETDVFRPDIVDMMEDARARLRNAPEKKPVGPNLPVLYFERDVPGLGKNYMKHSILVAAIESYSFFIRFYALRAFYRHMTGVARLEERVNGIESVLEMPPETPAMAHALRVIAEELPGRPVRDLLAAWVEHHAKYAESVRTSKERDDERGARIIPDYTAIHTPAVEDKAVRRVVEEQKSIESRVAEWLKGPVKV